MTPAHKAMQIIDAIAPRTNQALPIDPPTNPPAFNHPRKWFRWEKVDAGPPRPPIDWSGITAVVLLAPVVAVFAILMIFGVFAFASAAVQAFGPIGAVFVWVLFSVAIFGSRR